MFDYLRFEIGFLIDEPTFLTAVNGLPPLTTKYIRNARRNTIASEPSEIKKISPVPSLLFLEFLTPSSEIFFPVGE